MEKYIRVIEKLTIQGVVEWKDKEIEKTKEIKGNSFQKKLKKKFQRKIKVVNVQKKLKKE